MPQQQILKLINYMLAALWVYQGLLPKLIFTNPVEIAVWQWLGLSVQQATWAGQASGVIEILFGLAIIFIRHRFMHYLSIFGLCGLLVLMVMLMPSSLVAAFNPVVMNGAMMALSVVALAVYPSEGI
ncbi:DoxX-like family protein [Acinetobacter larvae]|uniref:DoxX-like family protein n=1 Tax=Acinetobacter larvae TaxID=1789224 RepID=A0A1B2M015_9GAMM|nr:DoxX-like family protein [Acinetobacter larvae]AOA58532.1 DoxX-like family protein [Acinetobacter larvae]